MASTTPTTESSERRPPNRVFGKFKCSVCTKQWNSSWTWIRKSLEGDESVVFGQKCKTCRGDFIDPYVWEPLQWCSKCDVQGSKCHCKSKTKRHNKDICGRCHSDDPCPDVPVQQPRNKDSKPYRVYGWFECNRCDRTWESAYTWVRLSLGKETPAFRQKCGRKRCRGTDGVYPVDWEPLKCPKCDKPVSECKCPPGSDDEGNGPEHLARYCEKCKSGNPCRKGRRKK